MGWSHVSLDGTLIEIDRVARRNEHGHHLWYSGKHKTQGGNVQIVADPAGFPVWSAPVEPGSVHDITAARAHCLGALYAAAGGPVVVARPVGTRSRLPGIDQGDTYQTHRCGAVDSDGWGSGMSGTTRRRRVFDPEALGDIDELLSPLPETVPSVSPPAPTAKSLTERAAVSVTPAPPEVTSPSPGPAVVRASSISTPPDEARATHASRVSPPRWLWPLMCTVRCVRLPCANALLALPPRAVTAGSFWMPSTCTSTSSPSTGRHRGPPAPACSVARAATLRGVGDMNKHLLASL